MGEVPATPELDKRRAVIESGQAGTVQAFIDWLSDNGYAIMRSCPDVVHETGIRYCGRCRDTGLVGPVSNFEELMAKHFGIDRNKIETEQRVLLAWIREQEDTRG